MESTHEMIERCAYELFLARGCANGYAMQDWLQAEKNVFAKNDNQIHGKQVQNKPVQKSIQKPVEKQLFTIKTKRIKDEQEKATLRNGFIALK